MQVVRCVALAASASALQQLPHAPYPEAGGQQSAQDDGQSSQSDGQAAQGDGQFAQNDGQAAQGDGQSGQNDGQAAQGDGQHTCAKSLSRAVCILDGPIQVHMLALMSLHSDNFEQQAGSNLHQMVCKTDVPSVFPVQFEFWVTACKCICLPCFQVMFTAFSSSTA